MRIKHLVFAFFYLYFLLSVNATRTRFQLFCVYVDRSSFIIKFECNKQKKKWNR